MTDQHQHYQAIAVVRGTLSHNNPIPTLTVGNSTFLAYSTQMTSKSLVF
ncbi:MAG: hypothetical protein MH252_12100 [Thermosynechococcaceae cyanobacterium MS004]|nr:hypothetical protein [Thermosynechococcaceae cyanobacterium MS004]